VFDPSGRAVIAPCGSGSIAADRDQQYEVVMHGLRDLSAVILNRLDAWELVGVLAKSMEARGLSAWLEGDGSGLDAREHALLYFAEPILFTMYDGEENQFAADELACKLMFALRETPGLTASAFVAALTSDELALLHDCVDTFAYSNDDEREDSRERWVSAREVIGTPTGAP